VTVFDEVSAELQLFEGHLLLLVTDTVTGVLPPYEFKVLI
jgi:hypothetical protein